LGDPLSDEQDRSSDATAKHQARIVILSPYLDQDGTSPSVITSASAGTISRRAAATTAAP
jgi:hypothetical protein